MTILVGTSLVIFGMLLLVWEALAGRPLSDRHRESANDTIPTLEPHAQGLGFLGMTRNWVGLILTAAGAMLLIASA
ncbi:hypothetical protein EV286_111135 [Rhizobium sp. BK251]|nr:hypothetical protein EV286_111135 [Rhizobium sp. BK251]